MACKAWCTNLTVYFIYCKLLGHHIWVKSLMMSFFNHFSTCFLYSTNANINCDCVCNSYTQTTKFSVILLQFFLPNCTFRSLIFVPLGLCEYSLFVHMLKCFHSCLCSRDLWFWHLKMWAVKTKLPPISSGSGVQNKGSLGEEVIQERQRRGVALMPFLCKLTDNSFILKHFVVVELFDMNSNDDGSRRKWVSSIITMQQFISPPVESAS